MVRSMCLQTIEAKVRKKTQTMIRKLLRNKIFQIVGHKDLFITWTVHEAEIREVALLSDIALFSNVCKTAPKHCLEAGHQPLSRIVENTSHKYSLQLVSKSLLDLEWKKCWLSNQPLNNNRRAKTSDLRLRTRTRT